MPPQWQDLPDPQQRRRTQESSRHSATGYAQDTKDRQALRSLNAYFDILRPPPKLTPEEVAAAEAVAAAEEEARAAEAAVAAARERPEVREAVRQLEEMFRDAEASGLKLPQVREMLATDLKPIMMAERGLSVFEIIGDQRNHASSLSAVNLLVALNVAVFLFELATPLQQPSQGGGESAAVVAATAVVSLPALYGAKVNGLIAAGQWWRLVTPMFLHDGIFHLALGTWGLLSLGPSVSFVLGPGGLLGAYVVGGLFGNLLSFGPVYGVLGAWLVYLLRNRSMIGAEEADGEIRKVVFLGALNIALGNPLPIDDWTHMGGLVGGAFFAWLAAPKLLGRLLQREEEDSSGDANAGAAVRSNEGGQPATAAASAPGRAAQTGEWGLFQEGPGPLQIAVITALCLGCFVLATQLAIAAATGSLPSFLLLPLESLLGNGDDFA
eukprot:SM000287S10619  [mRNA]  locus=s287:76127:78813:+ [translate_table: standard]